MKEHAPMTTPLIHPTAVIDPNARIGTNVSIGPYAIVGPHCVVGDNCQLGPHAILEQYVTLGEGCKVSPNAVLGGDPQDLSFKNEPTRVIIGNNTTIREGVTIHRAVGEGETTTVGNDCFIMADCHIAHNCHVGNEVILVNAVLMAGHVTVDDFAIISGQNVIHQFVHIGKYVMMGGSSGTRQDIPPFALANGRPAIVCGINKVGLRRRGFSAQERQNIQSAFDTLWFSNKQMTDALTEVSEKYAGDAHVNELLTFIRESKRGIHRPVNRVDEMAEPVA